MKLSFRYQFAFAPFVIVVLLACLVFYTLIELSNIRRENEETVKWEVLTDRIQIAIANASLLDRLVQDISISPLLKDDDRLFGYLDQVSILTDSLLDPYLAGEIPLELQKHIAASEKLLREPEKVSPVSLHSALTALLPVLEYQHKLFLAHRRTAFIDYHRNLSHIIPRLSGALLTVLVVCMLLAVGLTMWGLQATRQRLQSLTQQSKAVCTGDFSPLPMPAIIRDELDQLEVCLAKTTRRLFDVVAVEKVVQGAENERRRIAMDMHDGVLADLTILTRQIDTMRSTETSQEQLSTLRSGMDATIKDIRHIIDDLHPQTLEILGLEAALQSFLDRHCDAPGLPDHYFKFEAEIENQLQLFQKIHLFRIVAEAVHNVIRHAGCQRLEISMRIVARRLIVTVEDNGLGMPKEAISTSGHGCVNITERARMLGAQAQWHASRFSSGTCMELSLALELSA